jgi:methionine-rich copper-binding protein CopC
LRVINPQVAGSNDCSLGQFGTAPNRIVVTFNAGINKNSFNLATDVSVAGNSNAADPFRLTSGAVSKKNLTLAARGGFAAGSTADLTFSLRDIAGKNGTGTMSPWSRDFAVAGSTGGTSNDVTRPRITSFRPQSGAVWTQPTNFVEALFNEDLDPSTITSSSFQLTRSNGQPVAAQSVSYNSQTDTARFTTASQLPNDTYQIRLTSAILDLAGNALAGDQNGNFTSSFRINVTSQAPWTPPPIGPGDITPPTVTNVTPGFNSAMRTSPTTVVATFSEGLNAATVNASSIRVIASGQDGMFGNSSDRVVALQSVTYNAATRQAVVRLGEQLSEGAYRVEMVGDGGIRDLSGNGLDGNRDGRPGGVFSTDFRVDTTPPSVQAGLAAASDTGLSQINRTNRPNNIVFGGSVTDGTLWSAAGGTVRLDVDGDGFDDGVAQTDATGSFVVAAPPNFVVTGSRTVRLQVSDLAGNSTIVPTTFVVDTVPPMIGFANPIEVHAQAPATLTVLFSEPMNPIGVQDLSNYKLYASGRDGQFFDHTVTDVSHFLTEARYDAPNNKVTLSLAAGIPADSYRLVVKGNGTIEDAVGNHPAADGMLELRIGGLTRTSLPRPNLPPVNPSSIRQFPQYDFTAYETMDPYRVYQNQVTVRRTFGPVVDPNLILNIAEVEAPLGPASNNTLGTCETPAGFGQDPFEDPFLVLTGTDFGSGDVDFYCFRARAGENVKFTITDQTGLFLPTFPNLIIWDLGTDGAVGGVGNAADRQLVGESLFQFFLANNRPIFDISQIIPDFVDVAITGITGTGMDAPEDQVLNPLGSERREPQDRTYVLQVDADRFGGNVVQPYRILGEFTRPAPTASDTQQIIYVDFDGAQNVSGFEDSSVFQNPILVNVPAFDVRDYGLDPIFQDEFIDQIMADIREELERIRLEQINIGQNSSFGIRPFSYELRDSRHYPDPVNVANVLRIHVGGSASIADLPFGVIGIAEDVDTGNRSGSDNVLVFTKDLATFELTGVSPLGFGPSRIPELAEQISHVAVHEAGHVLGQWHTRAEGFEFCNFDTNPNCLPDFDNIIDPFVPTLGQDVHNRFDRYRDFGFTLGGVTTSIGLEFFEGVADSIGVEAWGMGGRDSIGPRVLDLDVLPGQIKILFSEAIDIATLTTAVGQSPTITLERSGFDNDFTTSVPITLLPVGTRLAAPLGADPCSGAIPSGISLYDECTTTLTLQVANLNDVVQNDTYRLTLSSTGTRAIRDVAGNALDGEINLPLSQRTNPQGDRFPSGNGVAGGSLQLTFLVTKNIGVDGDFTVISTAIPGTLAAPYTNIQQGLDAAQFANLASAKDATGNELPVRVRVAPAITPYLAFDARLDPTPLTLNDRGNLIVPDNTHLEIDASFEIARQLWVATPAPDDPTTPGVNESNLLQGLIFRVDANSPNGGAARVLGVFNAPVPTPGNVGMGYDGSSLYLIHDNAGADAVADTIYVLDPLTGQQTSSFTVPVSAAGGANISGLGVSDREIFVSDSETNTIIRLDKRPSGTTGVVISSFTLPFQLAGGIDYDAIHDTLWVSGIVAGALQLFELDPRTGALLSGFGAPGGSISGVGLVDGQPLFADPGSDLIYRLNLSNPLASQSFLSPSPGVSALAGVSESRVALKFLGTRLEVAGNRAALVARGSSIDNPVVFTSTRDNTVLGTGPSSAAPADWMGIAFRPQSDDFASRLENIAVHFAGGPGTVQGITQTLSPITLYDARPAIINAQISNNTEAAIAATPDAFERLLGRSGPELFWDVDSGVPIPGDWDPTTPGVEFGVFQSNTAKVLVDLNGDRILQRTEDLNCNNVLDPGEDQNRSFTLDRNDGGCVFGAPGETPVVGNFSIATAGEEIATFDRATGLWTIDLNRSFTLNIGDVIAAQFGQHGDIPIVGDWDGDGIDQIGVFRPRPRTSDSECLDAAAIGASCFILDLNNNRAIDLNETFLFGEQTDVPLVGQFAPGIPGDEIGVYRPSTGEFLLDRNGNRVFDMGEQQDDNGDGVIAVNDGPIVFGPIGGRPVIGDWCTVCLGDEIGVVDSSLKWLVDSNGNLRQDASEIGLQFGRTGDLPLAGDWSTELGDEFGVFRSSAGQWIVDSDSDNTADASEDLDLDGRLDVREDLNGNNRLDPGEDRDADGRLDVNEDLNTNGVLDRNDGPFKFSAALRDDISQFVSRNSLNAVWVKPGFQTVSDAHWDDVQIPYVLTGTVEVQALATIGVVPTLELEPGLVVKMGIANLSVGGFGSTLLIDSDLEIGEPRVVFTSLLDDSRGPNGRQHDTNNDSGALSALPGDWGGIILSPGSTGIINGADIQFAGNLRVPARATPAQSFFPNTVFQNGLVSPNPITLNGGPIFATITNNIIANTNNLNNRNSPRTLPSDVAAIGVVGGDGLGVGPNRSRVPFNANPFIRGNNVSNNNGINGLEIRTDLTQPALEPTGPNLNDITHSTFISQDSVWDDTDITHILLGTLNWSTAGPLVCAFITQFPGTIPGIACSVTLSLRSNPAGTFDEFDGVVNSPAESLVVKMGGRFNLPFTLLNPFPVLTPPAGVFFIGVNIIGAGFQMGWDDGQGDTAFIGIQQDWGTDSIFQVEGVAGNADVGIKPTPVVLTSIRDDSAGPRGPQDTNNDAGVTQAAPGDWAGLVFGAWARNFGRESPLNGAQLSSSYVRDADIRFASTGVLAQSQPMEISNSIIRSSRDFGIRALQGPNIADQPTSLTFNPNNEPRVPAAIQAWNNILVSNAVGIQQQGGPDNANFIQESKVPRSLIMHNTLHANTTAIALLQRSGPLIMNNAITGTGSTGTGITIDGTSINLPFEQPPQHERPTLLRNAFFGLANNGFTGSTPRGLGGLEILGVNPLYTSPAAPDFNFRPGPGSPLVDASVSEFGRPIDPIFDFFDPLWGLVRAPDRDKLGAFRRDHFGTSNVGVGQRPWLDIGAIELTDVVSAFPRVVSMNPIPNANFPNGFGPAAVELEFSEPVINVGATTFFVESSGGDQSFLQGNEVRLTGQISSVVGSGGTRWIFVPDTSSTFNNFQNETFRVSALGSGSTPIRSAASSSILDGEFLGAFPSGDGVEGGDYRATFTIGDVITGDILFVDDSPVPCSGVPRTDPNLQLFTSIQAALAVAAEGDTILVCPGVYTAPLTFTVPVTLESIEGALPRKDSQGQIIPGTGTFIVVTAPLGSTAITLNNVTGQRNPRIGSTRGGVNHGFVITTSPISGAVTSQPGGIGIDIVGTSVDIEANVIIANTIGVRADSAGTSRLPTILNNIIVGNTRGSTAGGAGIDITSRTTEALAMILNNTISYNQAGVLLREDGQDPQGRDVATVQNNIITSNSLTGLSTASPLATPNVFNNDAWGNASQTSNFGGTLANIPAGTFEPDCVPGVTRCGNISQNPLFVNPVDPRSVSDRADFYRLASFELQSTSQLIDRGLDAGAAPRDFKGRTRTIDVPGVGHETSPPAPPAPDSNPRSVDIGAFEFVPAGVASSIGQRSTSASTAASSAATDAVLSQLGMQVSQGSLSLTTKRKRSDLLIDEWLNDEF